MREKLSAHILKFGREKGLELAPKIISSRMNAVMTALRGVAEKPDIFSGRRDFIHVANGVVRNGADGRFDLAVFSPEHYSRNRCAYPYLPDAECPEFLSYLRSALPDDDIEYLQKWTGLTLDRTNPTQCFVILEGEKNTGKSTFTEIVRGMVGAKNTGQLRTDLLNKRFESYRCLGKPLLLAPDVRGNFLNSPSASGLKSLVGGDFISAEAKGSNETFDMVGDFNVLITSNVRLCVHVDGDAGAWERRIRLIRFNRPPPVKLIRKAVSINNIYKLMEACYRLWATWLYLETFGRSYGISGRISMRDRAGCWPPPRRRSWAMAG